MNPTPATAVTEADLAASPASPADPFSTADVGIARVDDAVRAATVLSPETTVTEAWRALVADPDGCAVVARLGHPLAVVTRARLAERWPSGGPWTLEHTTLAEVTSPLTGIGSLAPHEGLVHAARHLLATGLPALPVVSASGRLCGLVTVRTALEALVELVGRPGIGARDRVSVTP